MASTPRAFEGWSALAAALAAAGCLGFASLAIPAPDWVKSALAMGRNDQMHSIPSTARFSTDDGGWFILDRSQKPNLLRCNDDPDEIWVVSPSRGPRGDILFKDDIGDVLLRVTKFGGVTLFTASQPMGVAATLEGKAAPLHPMPMGLGGLYQRMVLASRGSTHAAHHLVEFEAPEADAHSAAAIADAALLAMNAIVAASSQAQGRAAIAHLTKVLLLHGSRNGAWMQHGVLIIQINPGDGYSGHPSSARLTQVISGP